jgi:hypothetical protein
VTFFGFLFPSVADTDRGSSAFLTPWIRDPGAQKPFLLVKILNPLMRIREPGWKKIGFGIRNPEWKKLDPGLTSRIRNTAFFLVLNFIGLEARYCAARTFKIDFGRDLKTFQFCRIKFNANIS